MENLLRDDSCCFNNCTYVPCQFLVCMVFCLVAHHQVLLIQVRYETKIVDILGKCKTNYFTFSPNCQNGMTIGSLEDSAINLPTPGNVIMKLQSRKSACTCYEKLESKLTPF